MLSILVMVGAVWCGQYGSGFIHDIRYICIISVECEFDDYELSFQIALGIEFDVHVGSNLCVRVHILTAFCTVLC